MTAEIAILNKEAVALAADSAVTFHDEKGQKIFPSANKIFMLSKYHPVGVMFFGNALFMGIPWEPIIKIYRSRLGRKKFSSLKEYGSDFINFLGKEKKLFPAAEQEMFFKGNVFSYFALIKEDIERGIEEVLCKKSKIANREIKEIITRTINSHYDWWFNAELIPSFTPAKLDKIKTKYNKVINLVKKVVFEKLLLTRTNTDKLKYIAVNLTGKFPIDLVNQDVSGIVIAGFGAEDHFPSLVNYSIEGIYGSYIKFIEESHSSIDFTYGARIISFAQSEMVHTFMEGVDQNYQNAIQVDLANIFKEYSDVLLRTFTKVGFKEQGKMKLEKAFSKINKKLLEQYIKGLAKYRDENYVKPTMKIVANLPKEEMAVMAETLVNLTSFKRRMSLDAETVGGPIDVAMISKGDGFIWIKRKHYFEKEINPSFFANYYREEKDGKKERN